jgi:hypothetical protein
MRWAGQLGGALAVSSAAACGAAPGQPGQRALSEPAGACDRGAVRRRPSPRAEPPSHAPSAQTLTRAGQAAEQSQSEPRPSLVPERHLTSHSRWVEGAMRIANLSPASAGPSRSVASDRPPASRCAIAPVRYGPIRGVRFGAAAAPPYGARLQTGAGARRARARSRNTVVASTPTTSTGRRRLPGKKRRRATPTGSP